VFICVQSWWSHTLRRTLKANVPWPMMETFDLVCRNCHVCYQFCDNVNEGYNFLKYILTKLGLFSIRYCFDRRKNTTEQLRWGSGWVDGVKREILVMMHWRLHIAFENVNKRFLYVAGLVNVNCSGNQKKKNVSRPFSEHLSNSNQALLQVLFHRGLHNSCSILSWYISCFVGCGYLDHVIIGLTNWECSGGRHSNFVCVDLKFSRRKCLQIMHCPVLTTWII
jgi:hypothetical protein